jgi:uncharacterized OB-fold protein
MIETSSAVQALHASALSAGRLEFQRCRACGRAWLPPREACPSCLGAGWDWVAAAGSGRLISWVVYHVAFDAGVADRLPYNVAIVELDEGPRLITNLVGGGTPSLDAPVRLVVETDRENAVQFRLTDATDTEA